MKSKTFSLHWIIITGVFMLINESLWAQCTPGASLKDEFINFVGVNDLYNESANGWTPSAVKNFKVTGSAQNAANVVTSGNIHAGATVPFNIDVSSKTDCGPVYPCVVGIDVAAYIDYNDDNVFQASELNPIGTISITKPNGAWQTKQFSGNLTIPVTANVGNHTMRVMIKNNAQQPIFNPCFGAGYGGDYQDYKLTIVAPGCTGADLATDGRFDSGVKNFTSVGYTLITAPAPSPGVPAHEIITNIRAGWVNSSWWGGAGTVPLSVNQANSYGGHGGGNYLLVDGTDSASFPLTFKTARPWCQTVNLTKGQGYDFSYYIANVTQQNNPALYELPSVETLINGVLQCTPALLPETKSNVWKKFEYAYTATVTGPSQFCITGLGKQYDGNDFAIDDIAIQSCNVGEQSKGSINCIPVSPSAKVDSVPESCPGLKDGKIIFSNAQGGFTRTYEYSIDGGLTWFSSGNYTLYTAGAVGSDVTYTFTGITASKTYHLKIRDKNDPTLERDINAAYKITSGAIANNAGTAVLPMKQACVNSGVSINLASLLTGAGVGVWKDTTSASPTTVGFTAGTGMFIPNGNAPGLYKFLYTVGVGACKDTTVVSIQLIALPPAPTGTSPTDVCVGGAVPVFTAVGTGLQWYDASTGGTLLSGAPTLTTAAATTVSTWVSQTVSGCEGPRLNLFSNVIASPLAPTGTSPADVCVGGTLPFFTAVGTGLKWYNASVGGTLLSGAPTLSTAAATTVSTWVSQTVSGCEGPRLSLVSNVIASPLAPTGTSPSDVCVGGTVPVFTAVGSGLKWYDASVGGTLLSGAPTLSTASATTVSTWVSQTVGGCEGPRLNLVSNVIASPLAPTGTSPADVCVGGTLPVFTAVGTGLKWYNASVGGTLLSGAPTLSTAAATTVSTWVSQTVSGCEGPRLSLVSNVIASPLAPTGTSPTDVCVGGTLPVFTAVGTGLKWYDASVGGTLLSGAPTLSTASATTVSTWVSQTVGGCEGPRLNLVSNVIASPLAPTGTSPTDVCVGGTLPVFTAVGTGLKWYDASVGGTLLSGAPTLSTATATTVSTWVSQTVSGCEGPRLSLVSNIIASPLAPTGTSPADVCVGGAVPVFTAVGSGLKWYDASVGGTLLSGVPTISTATATTVSTWVSQTVTGCEGSRLNLVSNVIASPLAPTGTSPADVCVGGTLPVFTAVGTGLKWYNASVGGTLLSGAPTLSTATATTVSSWVSQTVGGCEGPRLGLVSNVIALTSFSVLVTNPLSCGGTGSVSITILSAIGNYDIDLGGDGTYEYLNQPPSASGIIILPNLANGTIVKNTKLRSITTGCEAVNAIDDQVSAPGSPSIATPSQSAFCADGIGQVTLNATPIGGVWSLQSGSVGSIDAVTGVYTAWIVGGAATVIYTKNNCVDQMALSVIALPAFTVTEQQPPTCTDLGKAIISFTNASLGNYDIDLNGDGVNDYTNRTPNSGSIILANLPNNSAIKNVKITSVTTSCTNVFAIDKTIVVPTAPVNTTPVVSVCADGLSTVMLSTTTAGGLWTLAATSTVVDGNVNDVSATFTAGMSAGTVDIAYTLNGCTAIKTFLVTALPVIEITSVNPTTCLGTGTATINILSPLGVYDIDLDGDGIYEIAHQGLAPNAQGSIVIAGLASGFVIKNVKVKSMLTGCESLINPYVATLTSPGAPVITNSTAAMCADGTTTRVLLATPLGGIWSLDAASTASDASILSGDILKVGLNSGLVTVLYTVLNCTSQIDITVTAPPVISSLAKIDPSTCSGTGSVILTLLLPLGNYDVDLNGDGVYEYLNKSLVGNTIVISPLPIGYTAKDVKIRSIATGCESAVYSNTLTITSPNTPPPPLGVDELHCFASVNTSPLKVTGSTGVLNWYTETGISLGQNNPIASTNQVGVVIYKVTQTINGCISPMGSLLVTILPLPVVNAGVDRMVMRGESVDLLGKVTNTSETYTVSWSPDSTLHFDGNNLAQILTPHSKSYFDVVYKLTVTTANGCTGVDEVKITVHLPIQIPTAFSPNGDGLNEIWYIDGIELYPKALVEVFNRWGNIVYRSIGYDNAVKVWDGTIDGTSVPHATYYFIVDVNDGSQPRTGNVTIVR